MQLACWRGGLLGVLARLSSVYAWLVHPPCLRTWAELSQMVLAVCLVLALNVVAEPRSLALLMFLNLLFLTCMPGLGLMMEQLDLQDQEAWAVLHAEYR